jgi:hypothetical protein
MEDNKLIDGAEYISLEDAKRLKLPYFEGLAAGYPSPAGDSQFINLEELKQTINIYQEL